MGVIVTVAIVCVVIAVLASAQRANEVAFTREQGLIRGAIAGHGARVLRELESKMTTAPALASVRTNYDPQWVADRAKWLQTFYGDDGTVIVDALDQIKFTLFRSSEDAAADVHDGLTPTLA